MTLTTQYDRLPEQTIHDILRNERRRRVIEQLRGRSHGAALRTLAEEIATAETGERPPPGDVRNSVYVSLHQTHLPKLDEAGIVEYDRDRKTVSLQDSARQVELYMEVVTRYGITWAAYYRILGLVALLTVLAAELSVPGVSTIDSLLWISGFLVVLAVSTAYQLWSRRWLFLQQMA